MTDFILPQTGDDGAQVQAPDSNGAHPDASTNGYSATFEYSIGHANGTTPNGYPDVSTVSIPRELSPADRKSLEVDSAISSEVIAASGYATVTEHAPLEALGFPRSQWLVPALLCSILDAHGEAISYQIRPENPRYKNGKLQKYETRAGDRAAYHVSPTVRHLLRDPNVTLYITEGKKKADALASRGLCAIALTGVWNWRGTNDKGGATALASFDDIAWKGKDADGNPIQRRAILVFDSDALEKPEVNKALKSGGAYFAYRGAKVLFTYLPAGENGEKIGVDDFFARGGTVNLLHFHTTDALRPLHQIEREAEPDKQLSADEIRIAFRNAAAQLSEPRTLQQVKDIYRKWLHIEDDGLIEVVLGTVAANLMDGDPVWLMIIDRSGGGKTEHIQPLGALSFVHLAATVTEPALLSGTPKKEAATDAKGGLLRKTGAFGFLVLKDFTSILSMHHVARTSTIAALREIYDGHWSREIGSDGGRTLEWRGKLAVIAACTEAIDKHHEVIGSMGERFTFYRLPASDEKKLARKALAAIGKESQMREELSHAVAGLFAGLDVCATVPTLSDSETDWLIDLASFTARCRSAVDRDARTREIELIYKSEAPTRIAKVFARLYCGMVSIGVEKPRIYAALQKMALDSMHKTRRAVFEVLAAQGAATTTFIAMTADCPTTTARRALEELNAHRITTREKSGQTDVWMLTDDAKTLWDSIQRCPIPTVPDKSSNDISKIIKDDFEKDGEKTKECIHSTCDLSGTVQTVPDADIFDADEEEE